MKTKIKIMKTKIKMWLQEHIWACKIIATIIVIPESIVCSILVGVAEGCGTFKDEWKDYFEIMKM